ncbi:MAG TPA: BTAD domain-containing putative transcriptional regulator [Blastocatellia bacterium]|nr:BTAD domain-containing putative transcriptional regulator [Blastocatellia bacterium]
MEQHTDAPAAAANTPQMPQKPGFFFLRTRLLPPRPVPELLPRPRLTERLLANLTRPVTLVTANAGSGKTTLVAEFVRQHVPQYVWYQLDETDADPVVFLGYIAHGISRLVPGFGELTMAYLQQSADDMARRPERAADVLLNEILERVEQQLVLVLDDYHHLGTETAVHHVMDRILAWIPDVLHIIIISRETPPLNLTRMRSQSALMTIDRDELLFTDAETQELFRRVFDLELTPEQLREYRERTNGWITALQLVRQVAQRQALARAPDERAPDLSEILRQSERDIFDYFAEEVFAAEAEETQFLLLRIALLERIEAGTCAQLWPQMNCRRGLPALVRRNLFITVASDERGEEFRLHPLFQGFLRRRLLLEAGRAGVAAEHVRFADFFLSQEMIEPGVRHLLQAEEYERAAAIITACGERWLAAGALVSLDNFTSAIPAATLEAHPRLLGLRAEVARMRGEYDAAQQMLRRAAKLSAQRGDAEGEAGMLHSLATIARRRGDLQAAFASLDRAIELSAPTSPVRIRCGNTRGLCLLASGDLAAAEREFRLALQLAEEQGDEHHARLIAHNLGLPAMIRGDFGGALRSLRRLLREGDTTPGPRDAIAHLNIARCYFFQGDQAACEKHLTLALECSQLFNLTALRGEIFEACGNFYRESGDLVRATEFYERAARAYEEAGIDLTQHELLEEQAILCWQAGDLTTARARIDRLISARSAAGNQPGVFTASLARGRILLAQGDAAAAAEELQTACAHFRQQGLNYYEAQAVLALAACALETGREVEMLEHLRRAIDLAVRYDYEYWLQREVARNSRLFALPEAAELLPPELRELAQRSVPVATPPVRVETVMAAAPPVTDLTIRLLGPIEIFRDPQRQFAPDAWTTRRARDILCFIVTRPHRRASKDTIIDTFWGDSDPDVTNRNFHPTISHIRKALNSNQLIRLNFLLYRDGDYLLNPEFSCHIDTEEFDRLAAQGEAARRRGDLAEQTRAFEEAVTLYRGEFMQSVYDEWTNELRAYYREQYFRLLEALITIAQKTEDWLRSIQLARKILRDDPYREDIHCQIMRAHSALGKREAVREQFETLRKLLREELGVQPAAETQRVYRELMKDVL